MKHQETVNDVLKIMDAAEKSEDGRRCMVAPSPEARERIKEAIQSLRESTGAEFRNMLQVRTPSRFGLNDGHIYPESYFPVGTPVDVVRSAAANRAPLRGTVRVVVVLVDFSDQKMKLKAKHYEDLFFSTGVIPTGSVREYYDEATNGLVTITGQVVGPYRLPLTMAQYAHNDSGIGGAAPNAQTMALDAAKAANPDINFGPYDNDGDGFVDAFVVIHAGSGAEVTLAPGDIWSHKWVLSGGAFNADGTQIFAYLTVPEDARIGVCCHELGHLLFGFPDLYDTDQSSEGVGNWCLMGAGSWNGGGDTPAHPCAWAKADQGWVTVTNVTSNSTVSIADVKNSHRVYRLWNGGASGSEYFLVENRQKTGFDSKLPGEGLLIWHLDDQVANNTNELHPKVGLVQADGNDDLQHGTNRGDAGDPYPGSAGNNTFDKNSTPNSKTYANQDSCVAVTNIGPSGATMQATFQVNCQPGFKNVFKESKDRMKDLLKDKEIVKEIIDNKGRKEIKEPKEFKEFKEPKEFKEFKEPKEFKEIKEPKEFKEGKEIFEDKLPDFKLEDNRFTGLGNEGISGQYSPAMEQQLAALTPFISANLRPDLSSSALAKEQDVQRPGQQEVAQPPKRAMDTKAIRER